MRKLFQRTKLSKNSMVEKEMQAKTIESSLILAASSLIELKYVAFAKSSSFLYKKKNHL